MRWRKMNNAAAPAIQQPMPPQTINHQATNWPGIIIVGVSCALLTLPVIWGIGVFLFSKIGSDDPERDFALVIFGIAAIVTIGWLVKFVASGLLDRYLDASLELQREINNGLRYQQLTAQSGVTNSRQLGEDARLAKLAMLVMWQAYSDYSQLGQYTTNDPRPWSRRSVAALTIGGETKPVGEGSLNGKVKRLLVAENVIVADQINLEDFPTLDDVREMIERRYSVPVKFYGRVEARAPLPDQGSGFSQYIQK